MILTTGDSRITTLPVGVVVRVWVGAYFHVALMSDRTMAGERSVLSFSPQAGGFIEQPYSAFAEGRAVTVDGYFGTLPPWIVMDRARAARWKAYSWTQFNCEHFVRHAHGVPVESPQVRQWTVVGCLLGMFALAAART